MSPQRLGLLCGPSFSGKTTLARRIAARTGGAVVSLDAINARRGLERGFEAAPDEWARTHELARAEAARLLAEGAAVVIVDDTNCFRRLRDAFRDVGARAGAETTLLLLAPAWETIAARAAADRDEAARRGAAPDALRRHFDAFEWPDEDESPRRVEPDGDLGLVDDWS